MATSKPDDKKSIDDVSKPGKSLPSSSARPVIVSHKPLIQDPMMKPADEASTEPEVAVDEAIKPASKSKVIQPSSDMTAAAAEKSEAEASEEPETTATEETSDEAVVDAVAEQADKKKPEQTEEQISEEELKRQEALQKLVDSKRYFVKTSQVTKRRHTRNALIGLVLFVLLAGFGFLLMVDAGMLKVGFNAPFDLIKNTAVTTAEDTSPPVAQATPATKPAPTTDTKPEFADEPKFEWLTYKNTKHNYTVKYPKYVYDSYASCRWEKNSYYANGGYTHTVVLEDGDTAYIVPATHYELTKSTTAGEDTLYSGCEKKTTTVAAAKSDKALFEKLPIVVADAADEAALDSIVPAFIASDTLDFLVKPQSGAQAWRDIITVCESTTKPCSDGKRVMRFYPTQKKFVGIDIGQYAHYRENRLSDKPTDHDDELAASFTFL